MQKNVLAGIAGALGGGFLGLLIGRGSQLAESIPESPAPVAIPRGAPSGSDAAGPATMSEARKRITELESTTASQAREISSLRASRAAEGTPVAAGLPATHAAAGTVAAGGATVPATAAKSPAEVTARIEAIKDEMDSAFEQHDGRRALALLGELGKLGPEAYPLAIELFKRVENDVENDHTLNLSRFALYKILGSEAFVPVLQYAIANPEVDEGFRHRAAGTLVWSDAPDTASFLLRQMEVEKDPRLLSQMADSMGELHDPSALPGMLDLFARRPDQPEFRLSLIESIQEFDDPSVDQKLQSIAAVDPDAKVRAAAEVALMGRNPPVAGYLISQVFDGTQATKIGLQPGDLIVRYNDVPLNSREDLGRIARSLSPETSASMLVLRKGQYLTIGVKGGRIGIDGRAVQPRAR